MVSEKRRVATGNLAIARSIELKWYAADFFAIVALEKRVEV